MRSEILLPSGPGAYAEWPTLVGAPTPWEAVRDLDGKYIASAAAGLRHSFPVTLPVPAIANDETLVSAVYRASLATPADVAVDFQDGGFEQSLTYWTLYTGCAIQGATIVTSSLARSGLRFLRIQARTAPQTCGEARSTVSGLIPGRTYTVSGYYKTANVTTQTFTVTIDGILLSPAFGGSSPTNYTLFQIPFVATATSHDIGLKRNGQGAALSLYYFDDLFLVSDTPPPAVVTPFYRLYGINHDLASWTIPGGGGGVFAPQADRPISLYGYQLRDGGFELGVRNQNGAEVWLDQARLDCSFRFARDSMGFVGGFR